MIEGARLLKRGRTSDRECHRRTYRLQGATAILRGMGLEATYPDHDSACILHPDNRYNRTFGYSYFCECGRGNDPAPVWPEWVTDEHFDLAYRLADTEQTARGEHHQRAVNEINRARGR